MNHPRTWSTRRRAGLAACGLAVAAAVGVPTVAMASSPAPATTGVATAAATTATDPTHCTPAQRWDALAVAAPKIAAYLDAHPDLSTEIQTLKALPKDQRAAAAKTYFAAHPDEKAALKDARSALRTYRTTCHS